MAPIYVLCISINTLNLIIYKESLLITASDLVTQAYMNRYATKRRLNGRKPTDEDIARIHNGGPNGYRKPETEAYWNKVKKNLTGKKKEL